MTIKNFGFVKSEAYLKLNDVEKSIFLKENKFTQDVISARSSKFEKTNDKGGFILKTYMCSDDIRQEFSTKLINEVYFFLTNFFQNLIETNLMLLNRDLEHNTFGFSKKKRKKIALNIFNKIYFEIIDNEQISLGKNKTGEIGAAKRLAQLHGKQSYLIDSLGKEKDIIINYLFGNKDFFNRDLIDSNLKLLEIFEFENRLSKLLFLNKKFNFEKDDIFTPKPLAEIIFGEFSDKFTSVEVIQFIEFIFNDSFYKERKYGLALFSALKERLQLTKISAEKFNDLITEYFDCGFKNLRQGNKNSLKHIEYIEMFVSKWEEFKKNP